MSKGIYLSEKHGLNPCIERCFWCGGEKNAIALLGKLPNDEEAPMSAVLNYEPCNKCKEEMELGIACLEVTDNGETPPIQGNLSPTGRWTVITEEAVLKCFPSELVEEVLQQRECILDAVIFEHLFGFIFEEES